MGPLLEQTAWQERLEWLGKERREALLAIAAQETGGEAVAVGLIGSFTYDSLGWDDIDLVMVKRGAGGIDVRAQTLAVAGACVSIDLICISRDALADPAGAPDTQFPRFTDSRGRDYAELCMRRRCMLQALKCSLNFAYWLVPPDPQTRNALSAGEADLVFLALRLLAEARAYLPDPEDRAKGLRRLEMTRLVARQRKRRLLAEEDELLVERLRRDCGDEAWKEGVALCERLRTRLMEGG